MSRSEIVNYMNEAKANYEKYRELYFQTLDDSYKAVAQWWWAEFNKAFDMLEA